MGDELNVPRDELIVTRDLTKVYGAGDNAVRALDGVNLTVRRGELMAIMGPSGCGKSTLLNMLGALDQPSSGEVWVNGENLVRLHDVDSFRAKTVGFVFQLHNLLPTLTALENIEVPMQGRVAHTKERRARAEHLLATVGLGDRAVALPAQLSGGQRQRVAVARALANSPALLLADEPTGSLDSQSGEEVLALLAELNRAAGTTIVIVTHDRRVAQSTQRIVRMKDGRIVADTARVADTASVADHRLLDPLEEDLRMLAQTKLGQAILSNNGSHAGFLTEEEQDALQKLLARVAEGH